MGIFRPYINALVALMSDKNVRHFAMTPTEGTPVEVTFVLGSQFHRTAGVKTLPADFYYSVRKQAWIVVLPHKINGSNVEGHVEYLTELSDGSVKAGPPPGLIPVPPHP